MSKNMFRILMMSFLFLASCGLQADTKVKLMEQGNELELLSKELEPSKIIVIAEKYLNEKPITITSFKATRSSGGRHDYYSEGSYWWENPNDPSGPFIRKDGERNPQNFKDHKRALREFCLKVTTLTAAYELTNDERFALHAIDHILAWFANPLTKMNPNLLYAQAIKGISTGRGIGIIDTVRLIDVAMSILFLEDKNMFKDESLSIVKKWFSDYSDWLTNHPYGIDEKNNNNNHSTWWGAQVAAYAKVAERDDVLKLCQVQFKNQLDIQMAMDGSFPEELSRTKPFHYMNYNLRAWTAFAILASTSAENLWDYETKNGSLKKAVEFASSFYKNPKNWMYHTEIEKTIQPQQNDFLVFAYWGLGNKSYLELWKKLEENESSDNVGKAHLVIWENRILK